MSEPSSRSLELARMIIGSWVDGRVRTIALALDAARAEERERCKHLIRDACNANSTSDFSEAAADAFNEGAPKRPMAERLQAFGDVIIEKIVR